MGSFCALRKIKRNPLQRPLLGAKRSFVAEMPRNTRNVPSVNARLGPEETANTGGLNRNYTALNVWWHAAASNLEGRPETARNGRVSHVFDAAGRRPAERKFITFYYWLPLKFRFLAQQPPNKVESFLPQDSDPLT